MKTLYIRNKEFSKAFKQVRGWFSRNPNRKFVRLRTENSTKTIAKRAEYIK